MTATKAAAARAGAETAKSAAHSAAVAPVPHTRTVMEPDARRGELLTVAREVFLQRGIAQTTLGDIATAAGVTRGLVYHYFGDKQGLVDQVLAGYVAEFVAAVRQWDAARTPGDIDGALTSCIELFRGRMRATKALHEALAQAEGAGLYNQFLDQVVDAIVECLQVTTVKAYAQRHRIEIAHVRETFTVLVYGLIALVRTKPSVSDSTLAAIVRQTLHLTTEPH